MSIAQALTSFLRAAAANTFAFLRYLRARGLFETSLFGRLKLSERPKINLGFLSYVIYAIETKLTFRTGAMGKMLYGNMQGGDDMAELESIQAWLMDPVQCPTVWGIMIYLNKY